MWLLPIVFVIIITKTPHLTFRLPSRREDEAKLHVDLCLEYMEIVDKQIVDEVPKIFIMMLVHKVTPHCQLFLVANPVANI